MADESIVIEVKDSVDGSIATKIRAIATEAKNAHSELGFLRQQLSSLNLNKLNSLTGAATTASSALEKVASAQSQITATANMSSNAQSRLEASVSSLTARFNTLSASIDANANAARRASAATRTQADDVAALLGKIDPTVAALGRLDEQEAKLTKFKKLGLIDSGTFDEYKAKLDQARVGLGKFDEGMQKASLSAKQLRQATLYLPNQIGDLARSIAAGQSPFTALFQQGSQLSNMFGGLGNAAKALGGFIVGMINPFTLGAAALGVFAFAAYKAETSLRELNGIVAQFTATGRNDVDNTFISKLRKELQLLPGVSKATATLVIREFADIRDISGSTMKAAAGTVADLATALGVDAPKAAKKLAEALYDPIKGAQDLDKSLGFLTISDFKAIKNMDKLGQTAQAQTFLIGKLKTAIDGLAYDSLTPLQKATTNLGNAWSKFTDKLADSTATNTVLNTLAKLLDAITAVLNAITNWQPPAWFKDVENFYDRMNMFSSRNTGGASGSFPAPQTTAQSQTTKFKTDAAGITGKKSNAGENRASALAKINAQLSNEIKLMGMLGPEREKQEMFDRIQEGLLGRKIKLNDAETASIKSKIAAIVQGAALQAETNRIYEEAVEPLRTYNAVTEATANLLTKKAISEAEANKQNLIAFERYANIVDPIREYNTQLEQQLKLTRYNTDESEIETAVMSLQNELLTKGIVLRGDQLDIIRESLKINQTATAVQSAYNAIYDKTTGALTGVVNQTTALNKANADGLISAEMYQIKLTQLGVAAANIRLAMGGQDFSDVALASFGKIVEGYEGMLSGLTSTFGDFFSKLDDGFANSVGRAVVYSENLGDALQNVAREALSSLIGALVKLGVQYVVNAALGNTLAATSTATGAALAAASAAAWAPAAALASLASFGANAAPAAAGIASTVGLASTLASVGRLAGFQSGGYTGNMATDAVAGVVHGREFVMDAAATNRIGAGNLEALRTGAASLNSNSSTAGGGSSSGGDVSVVVENYGTPQTYEQVPTMTPGEVRLIARDEVAKGAPDVIASNIANPNSVVRKSMAANTNITRK